MTFSFVREGNPILSRAIGERIRRQSIEKNGDFVAYSPRAIYPRLSFIRAIINYIRVMRETECPTSLSLSPSSDRHNAASACGRPSGHYVYNIIFLRFLYTHASLILIFPALRRLRIYTRSRLYIFFLFIPTRYDATCIGEIGFSFPTSRPLLLTHDSYLLHLFSSRPSLVLAGRRDTLAVIQSRSLLLFFYISACFLSLYTYLYLLDDGGKQRHIRPALLVHNESLILRRNANTSNEIFSTSL